MSIVKDYYRLKKFNVMELAQARRDGGVKGMCY